MAKIELTREQDIEATMGIFGVDRMTAEGMVPVERGESAGACVAIDENGKELALAEVRRRRQTPAA